MSVKTAISLSLLVIAFSASSICAQNVNSQTRWGRGIPGLRLALRPIELDFTDPVESSTPTTQSKVGVEPNYFDQAQQAPESAVSGPSVSEYVEKASKAHKILFFQNDFSYLAGGGNAVWFPGEGIKRRCLPGGGYYDLGGQYRTRFHSEGNMRGLGLTGVDDKFLLQRTRLYGDFHFSPSFRVYAEMLDAVSSFEDFLPRPIEENRAELQNLFFDWVFWGDAGNELTARIGRQEILLGDQRLISPLDWANTRRTFEGAQLLLDLGETNLSAFWFHPLFLNTKSLDSPDRDQEFMGLYSSSKLNQDQNVDLYLLRYLNGRGANNFRFNTVGARLYGNRNGLLWDFESAYQFGSNTNGSDHSAGTATFGLGRKWSNVPWKPVFWCYYDWASGDQDLGAGNGFHHLFPLAHKYNGFMDLFGRRNLEDVNCKLIFTPAKKTEFLIWYHYFFLETQSDTPYSVTMTPFNAGNAPGSADLGHEIDFTLSFQLRPRNKVLLGYSHFFSGEYYNTTAGVPFDGDADFFYSQYSIDF